MMKQITLFLIAFLIGNQLLAQRPSTNDFIHYYEGNKNYSTLLIAPGTLGPNALPVPATLNGRVGTDSQFKVSIDNYFRDGGGDNGHTLRFDFRFPVVQNFMAFGLEWNVVDYFRTTNAVRDYIQLYEDDQGWTNDLGDIILNTYIQVLYDREYWPDIMLVSSLKTTSGSIHDGRYTDLPAHWHYFSMGKNLISSRKVNWRLNGMAGYYFWQTNQTDLEQNEGPLWGLEAELDHQNFSFSVGTRGYNGWKYYGKDRPALLDSRLVIKSKKWNYFAELKTGLRDYLYSSFNIGVNWHPESPFKLKK